MNVVDLKDRFTTGFYPTPHSDIVALMVLEHQVGMLNRLARAGMETRMALHYQGEMNKALGRPADERSDSAWSRIRGVGDDGRPVHALRDEARLTDRVEGTSSFATDFAARGPRDSKGPVPPGLRPPHPPVPLPVQLPDLLPGLRLAARRGEGLHLSTPLGHPQRPRRPARTTRELDPEDAAAILEILRETKPDLPDYWKAPPGQPAASR